MSHRVPRQSALCLMRVFERSRRVKLRQLCRRAKTCGQQADNILVQFSEQPPKALEQARQRLRQR